MTMQPPEKCCRCCERNGCLPQGGDFPTGRAGRGPRYPHFETELSKITHQQIGAILGSEPGDGQDAPGRALAQKMMEAMIDEMVAQALVRGRRTTSVLGGIFNLLPGLSGR